MGFGGEMKNSHHGISRDPFQTDKTILKRKLEVSYSLISKKNLLLKEAIRYHKSRKEE